jgi:predicted flap endonuclease-1-like 5' DNA nuclease
MGTQAAFVLGLLAGIFTYWFIYRIFWQRWRAAIGRDMAYLQEKIKSEQYTSSALERQISAQKGELAELRVKITDLEREKRQAHAKLVEVNEEKESLVSHLDILRVELEVYKKLAAPTLPAAAPAQPQNGKTYEVLLSSVPVNGIGGKKLEQSKKAPGNGKVRPGIIFEPAVDPVMVINRPRMDGDRLEIIQGLSPAIVKKLRQAGIDSFLSLSQMTAEQLQKMVGARAAKQIDVEKILEQARQLASARK